MKKSPVIKLAKPKLSKRFRPKLESRLLTELNDAAWQSWHDYTFPESRIREIEEILDAFPLVDGFVAKQVEEREIVNV